MERKSEIRKRLNVLTGFLRPVSIRTQWEVGEDIETADTIVQEVHVPFAV